MRHIVDENLTDVKWREVFIIISELLPPYADNFFLSIVSKINNLIDEHFLVKLLENINCRVQDEQGDIPDYFMRSVILYFVLADPRFIDKLQSARSSLPTSPALMEARCRSYNLAESIRELVSPTFALFSS